MPVSNPYLEDRVTDCMWEAYEPHIKAPRRGQWRVGVSIAYDDPLEWYCLGKPRGEYLWEEVPLPAYWHIFTNVLE